MPRRQPVERSVDANEEPAQSYLDNFLNRVTEETDLPSELKTALKQLRDLDTQVRRLLAARCVWHARGYPSCAAGAASFPDSSLPHRLPRRKSSTRRCRNRARTTLRAPSGRSSPGRPRTRSCCTRRAGGPATHTRCTRSKGRWRPAEGLTRVLCKRSPRVGWHLGAPRGISGHLGSPRVTSGHLVVGEKAAPRAAPDRRAEEGHRGSQPRFDLQAPGALRGGAAAVCRGAPT